MQFLKPESQNNVHSTFKKSTNTYDKNLEGKCTYNLFWGTVLYFFAYSRGTLCYVYLFDMITNSSNSRQYVLVENSTLVYHNTLHCWCVQYNSTTM